MLYVPNLAVYAEHIVHSRPSAIPWPLQQLLNRLTHGCHEGSITGIRCLQQVAIILNFSYYAKDSCTL